MYVFVSHCVYVASSLVEKSIVPSTFGGLREQLDSYRLHGVVDGRTPLYGTSD